MRILHTSDWHLGRIFHGVHLTEDQAHILESFIQVIPDTKPDVILIAGDVYDRSVPPVEAVRLLDEVISKILLDYKVPIIMVAGNHDSPDRLNFGNKLLKRQGLHIYCQVEREPQLICLHDEYGEVYFCPIPYAEPIVVRDRLSTEIVNHNQAMSAMVGLVAQRIPAKARRVAIAHAFVTGSQSCESERPLSVGGADNVDQVCFQDFNYVALGHLHQPQSAGTQRVRYSGSLMKYSFAESSHNKGINLIQLDGKGDISLEHICLNPKRDVRCVEGLLTDILTNSQKDPRRDDYLMVTLQDKGAIYDAMGQIRKEYPNVLHIERPNLALEGHLQKPGGDYRKLDELELFSSFYQQVSGEELGETHRSVMAEVLDEARAREREIAG